MNMDISTGFIRSVFIIAWNSSAAYSQSLKPFILLMLQRMHRKDLPVLCATLAILANGMASLCPQDVPNRIRILTPWQWEFIFVHRISRNEHYVILNRSARWTVKSLSAKRFSWENMPFIPDVARTCVQEKKVKPSSWELKVVAFSFSWLICFCSFFLSLFLSFFFWLRVCQGAKVS